MCNIGFCRYLQDDHPYQLGHALLQVHYVRCFYSGTNSHRIATRKGLQKVQEVRKFIRNQVHEYFNLDTARGLVCSCIGGNQYVSV